MRFYVLFKVFQSYQDDGRLIMKGYVQGEIDKENKKLELFSDTEISKTLLIKSVQVSGHNFSQLLLKQIYNTPVYL